MGIYEGCFKFYNVEIRIKSNSPDMLNQIKRFFIHFRADILINPIEVYLIEAQGRAFFFKDQLIEVKNLKELLICSEREIFNSIIKDLDFVVLHSGAISFNDQGALLVGHGKYGKTSLTINLVKKGLKYLSDDIAPIDEELRLQPFPKMMSIRTGTLESFAELKDYVDPEDYFLEGLGEKTWFVDLLNMFPNSLGKACEVKYIFLLTPQSKNGPRVDGISRGECLIELMKTTLKLENKFERSLSTLSDLVENTECYRLFIGDLDATADLIIKRLEDEV